MEPHLPHDILYRPKMGFAVPLARWFRGPLRAARARRRARRRGSPTPAASTRATCEQLVDEHQSGARDYSAPLWTLLMFEAFLRNVVDRRDAGAAAPARPRER